MRLLGRLSRDQRGQSLAEFALLSTPLFLLLAGMLQFGFIYATRISVENMARDGARAAALLGTRMPAGDTATLTAVKNDAGVLSTSSPTLTIVVSPAAIASRTTGSDITVTVTYQQTMFIPWIYNTLNGGSTTFNVSQAATFRSQH